MMGEEIQIIGPRLFLLFCVLYSSEIISATTFRRPCLDLTSECLARSLQLVAPIFIEGNTEYGLETLDPYYIDRLDLTLPGGMVIEFTQGIARGLKNCLVDFAKLDGNILETQYHCNLTIKGRYRSKGKMLMFPIDGDGESTVKCRNLKIHSVLKLGSRMGSDSRKYLEILDANVTNSYDGRVSYSMTDLFKGNPEINRAVLEFMNSNWRLIAEEFGKPMVDFGVACVMKNLQHLLKVMPLEEIFPVPINF